MTEPASFMEWAHNVQHERHRERMLELPTPRSNIADPVFMECTSCGHEEIVSLARLVNGDTRWFFDGPRLRVGDRVRGLCCGPFCMP